MGLSDLSMLKDGKQTIMTQRGAPELENETIKEELKDNNEEEKDSKPVVVKPYLKRKTKAVKVDKN